MPAVATQADSLRWELSASEILSLTATGGPAGCEVVTAAARNGPGIGLLQVGQDGASLQWRAPYTKPRLGGRVAIPSDGTYLLTDQTDPSKWVRVEVTRDFLVPSAAAEVELVDVWQNVISADDVTAGEASAGDVLAYTAELHNDGPMTAYNVRAWLDSAASSYLEIATSGGGPWSAPTTDAGGLALADIAPGGSVTLHLQRTIPSSTSFDPRVLAHVLVGFDSI